MGLGFTDRFGEQHEFVLHVNTTVFVDRPDSTIEHRGDGTVIVMQAPSLVTIHEWTFQGCHDFRFKEID